MIVKYPADILQEILQQRGKIVSSIDDPFSATFLRFIKRKKGNRDFLYNEMNDRNKRNEILYAIYNNLPIALGDNTVIPPQENGRNLYSSTFEWYVAELLYREFQFFASAYGIKIQGSPEGGDFDVIGATHSGLITIECKSGKPRGIDEAQIHQFVKRHNFLRADYSIMYIDYKGLEGSFPFKLFTKAVHGAIDKPKVFRVEPQSTDTNANFYAIEGANIYVVDNSKSTGNVIKNLRFAIDTHFALRNAQNRFNRFDPKVLKESFNLFIDSVY